MPGRLDGKVVLVTGGGSGIGRATALRVAREGARVMIADYVPEGALKTVAMLREAGGTSDCIAADVSLPGQVEAMVAKTVATFGRLDCAFNNAGIAGAGGGAAKHGVVGLTRTAALEYAQKNIRVNCVCPGFIRTPMLERGLDAGRLSEEQINAWEPVGRMGTPEEIAESVLWLMSDAASFVTGHPMSIDGGYVAR
jgi:NAD(P)-dependent dehydrogenase (short-subunit alcohol dehydrogenase family)